MSDIQHVDGAQVAQADQGSPTSEKPANAPVDAALVTQASSPDGAVLPAVGAAAVLLVAAGLFAVVAGRTASGASEAADHRTRDLMQENRSELLDAAAKPITVLSLPLLVVSATAALAFWLKREGRTNAAVAIGIAPLAAAALGQSFTSFFHQRNPPDHDGSNGAEPEASFPSGHTTGVTAEGLTMAWVLSREELASPAVIAALLAWPATVGVARLYRNRHWLSDVLGGWLAGTTIAAGASLVYEMSRTREINNN